MSESEDNEAQEEEMDFQKRVHTKMVKSWVTIFIPHDNLKSKEMVSCSMKNNISSPKLSAESGVKRCHNFTAEFKDEARFKSM